MRFLYYSAAGSADPNRAVFPFVFAQGALEEGHEAEIFLAGEAVYLMKEEVARETAGLGWGAVADAIAACTDKGVPIHI